MSQLSHAVGPKQPNISGDVRAVQRWLNRFFMPTLAPVIADGLFDPATAAAIVEFQRRLMHMASPDGIVSPHGATLGRLAAGPSGWEMMEKYRWVARHAPGHMSRDTAFAYLNDKLPQIWERGYSASGGELLVVTVGGKLGDDGVISTMFDLRQKGSGTDDRVVAVWGLSKAEPANTRDSGRMKGFLGTDWSKAYPGRDRGHFFAHTMGGGTDINLFPQAAAVNRGGEWRRMERYAADHPGTFCFMRPIYKDLSWTPSQVEYGIYTLPPADTFRFWGNLFAN